MAGIIALRSSKTLDEVKKLVMKDLAVQQQLLDVVSVPLQRRDTGILEGREIYDLHCKWTLNNPSTILTNSTNILLNYHPTFRQYGD